MNQESDMDAILNFFSHRIFLVFKTNQPFRTNEQTKENADFETKTKNQNIFHLIPAFLYLIEYNIVFSTTLRTLERLFYN